MHAFIHILIYIWMNEPSRQPLTVGLPSSKMHTCLVGWLACCPASSTSTIGLVQVTTHAGFDTRLMA